MKNAFTMIELIFVIVILGILAAVAIPRLSATRDDATVSALAYSVVTGTQEIADYVVSKGESSNSIVDMSNSFAMLEAGGKAVLLPKKVIIKAGNVSNCITLEVNTTAAEEILQMTQGNVGGDTLCADLLKLVHVNNYPMRLRGAYVVQ